MAADDTNVVESVFHAVMKASPDERENVLTHLTAGKQALQAEVRSLIEALHTDNMLSRLDSLANTVESWLEHVPDRLGRYRVIQQIGEGGWGRVFEAEQDEPFVRKVAIKILHPGMNSRSVLRRFRRELDSLARMEHPGIAQVFDAGTTAQGLPYIVMELIEGQRIDTFCEVHCLDLDGRIALMKSVCDAIAHAHARGVVHRDLKPSNILVQKREFNFRPVVIDFGIAKALTDDSQEHTTTGKNLRPGTPEYMSPEQTTGGAAAIDTRTDIYSLGVVLYRMVTGKLPFTAERSSKLSDGDLLKLIREHDAIPPSSAVCDEAIQLPREIDWIIRRCLAKNPDDRYETVSAMRDDLTRFLKREPLEAGPPTTRYRVHSFLRRHPLAVGLALSMLLALLIGGGLATWGFV